MNRFLTFVVVAALVAGFFGFTGPGHRVLNKLGFATAECSGSSC